MEKDIRLINRSPEKCCGCTACLSACPVDAISMIRNKKGFMEPVVNYEICISCGKCEKVCPFLNFVKSTIEPKCFAARHKNVEEVLSSRSGAFFIGLAEYILNKNGIVYGVKLDETNNISYYRVSTKHELDKLKGSKYVQANVGKTFKECKKDLMDKRYVLFSGTPCHIEGLIEFLKLKQINISNLITCDIVCHGTPSPLVWNLFTNELSKKGQITSFNFRDKKNSGWKASKESYIQNKHYYLSKNSDGPWTKMFYSNCLFRESCFVCPFATPYRNSDFTIGDYWGIEKNVPLFDDDKGTSLVLLRTKKAIDTMNKINDSVDMVETKLETSMQPRLVSPAEKGKKYNLFWHRLFRNQTKTIRYYFFPSRCRKIWIKTKSLIKKILHK